MRSSTTKAWEEGKGRGQGQCLSQRLLHPNSSSGGAPASCPVSCTPQKRLPGKPKGLLWACRVKANSVFTAAGKVKLKHEQGSIRRCLGEEATAAPSSCSSESCSPGAFVKTRSKGCVQAGPLILWSPQREARPRAAGQAEGNWTKAQGWATSTDCRIKLPIEKWNSNTETSHVLKTWHR